MFLSKSIIDIFDKVLNTLLQTIGHVAISELESVVNRVCGSYSIFRI